MVFLQRRSDYDAQKDAAKTTGVKMPSFASWRGVEARPVFLKRRRASVEFFPEELLRIRSEEGVGGCAWSRERGGGASGARRWLTSPEVEEKWRRMVRTPASNFSSLAARFEEEVVGKNCGGGEVYKGGAPGNKSWRFRSDLGLESEADFRVRNIRWRLKKPQPDEWVPPVRER